MPRFELVSDYEPTGDQPDAIEELVDGIESDARAQTLLGVTGSGKSFTIANVIERTQKPTLIIAPNKTLAAQLFNEFKEFFPHNAVEFFVSYYDYYQPEAYVPSTDTFIEKDANINDAIDRMRHSATHSLLTRNDVIIVASVSCIYGIGTAEAYVDGMVYVEVGEEIERDDVLRKLVNVQYERAHADFKRGTFRVRGDTVEIFPAYENSRAVRVEWFGDEIEAIYEVDSLRGAVLQPLDKIAVFPASHYVVAQDRKQQAVEGIKAELMDWIPRLRADGKLLEAQRLEQRTRFDLEMMVTMGYCNGIENYARHLTGRAVGEPPPCLLNYFPRDYLLVIDESHVTVSQVGGMYRGDRSRKGVLVEYGFRLPSAMDNRPLNFQEFEALVNQVIFVSATPAAYEIEASEGVVVEQLIRPTGLLDPEVEVRPAMDQVDDAIRLIRETTERGYRVLVTVLTKRMAEDLTEFLADIGIRVRYIHSDIDTLERSVILRDLRRGVFDVLVGINLLREGIDIPEVALVVVLDADKEGFLRSRRSLIQTMGRAARNLHGRAVLYADQVTGSMKEAIGETERRREIQAAYNLANGVEPTTIVKPIRDIESHVPGAEGESATGRVAADRALDELDEDKMLPDDQIAARIAELRGKMHAAAEKLEFELAAVYRDRVGALEERLLGLGAPAGDIPF